MQIFSLIQYIFFLLVLIFFAVQKLLRLIRSYLFNFAFVSFVLGNRVYIYIHIYIYIYTHTHTHILLLLLLSHFSRIRLCATLWTVAYQAPPSPGFSRQEYCCNLCQSVLLMLFFPPKEFYGFWYYI